MNMITKLGAVIGTIAGVIGLWATLEIATSKDIRKLDCKYAPAAIAAYNAQRLNLLAVKPAETPESQNAWKLLLDQSQRDIDAAVEHRIKCLGQ